MAEDLAIRASKRFRDAHEALSPGLRGKVIGAVHDFARRYEADRRNAVARYDRLAHFRADSGELLEIDVTSHHRLLALWTPPRITLLNVGDKAIVPRYRKAMLDTDLASAGPASQGLYPDAPLVGDLFENADSRNWTTFAGEDSPDWLYHLAPNQAAIVKRIQKQFSRSSVLDPNRYFVVGGPGTGKTSVLLSLLIGFTETGKTVELKISDELAVFLGRCGIDLSRFRETEGQSGRAAVDVILVDDPGAQYSIQGALDAAYGASRCVVVAFDPCQLDSDLTDVEYHKLVLSNEVTAYPLRDSYRQKDVAGRAAKHVIDRVAESSPFLADAKKAYFAATHQQVFSMANEIRFINSGGVTRVWEHADETVLAKVGEQVQRRKTWGLAAPPILVVVDEFTQARDWSWKRRFGSREAQVIGLKQLMTVKGLEFQWVVLVIRESLYSELQNGFAGATQRVYQYRRLLRIPFTRARDGILTMVLPDVERDDVLDWFRWS